MRKFKLINARGIEFDLMRKDAFFHLPDGLGYTIYNQYAVAGTEFALVDSQETQTVIAGEMVFAGYAQYTEFAKFISDTMTLGYMTDSATWNFKDVRLQSIGKTELNNAGYLICPVNFEPYGQWYKVATFEQTARDDISGKVYDYTYPYTYSDEDQAVCEVTNNGHLYAPCRLHIFGPCSGPVWSLTNNGQVTARGHVNIELQSGNKLVVDSNPLAMEIGEYTLSNEFVRNAYQLSDFSTARFLYLPPGQSTIQFRGSGAEIITAFVEVREIARTV